MFWKQKRIYLDYAAATPVRREALRAYNDAVGIFGNPSGLHGESVVALELLEKSRESIARVLQCRAGELIFTSGGTEGNNIALFGSIKTPQDAHIVVSALEHPSVLRSVAALEQWGATVTRVVPDSRGQIQPSAIAEALTPQTALVSIGWANGEIGVVQVLSAIAKVIRAHETRHSTRVLFHSDAGQALLYQKNAIHSLGVDLMTFDSGKMYGPRGIGALFILNGVELRPTIFGGKQEKGIRPGTENVALAAGFAAAVQAVAKERDAETVRLTTLQALLIAELEKLSAVVNGGGAKNTLPHIVNVSIPDIDTEYVALALDHRGVAISTKTSCEERERESAVVKALGGELWRAGSALRFSMGRDTTEREVVRATSALAEVITLIRSHQKTHK